MSKAPLFTCSQPCNNCPYRKDAPLKHWAVEEFEKLMDMEQSQMGTVYGCHKNNGTACVGWLMHQDRTGVQSIALRLAFIKNGITRAYLDKLSSPSKMYRTVLAMCRANYPKRFK